MLAALSVRGGVGGNSHVPYRDSRLTQLLWEGLRSVGCLLSCATAAPWTQLCGQQIAPEHELPAALVGQLVSSELTPSRMACVCTGRHVTTVLPPTRHTSPSAPLFGLMKPHKPTRPVVLVVLQGRRPRADAGLPVSTQVCCGGEPQHAALCEHGAADQVRPHHHAGPAGGGGCCQGRLGSGAGVYKQ